MSLGCGFGAIVLLSVAAVARPAVAAQATGSDLVGFVEDSHGAPLAGAVISIFGRGLGGGGLITLSDTAGRFFLPALRPGSYTLRALRDGHLPAPVRRITVFPDRDAVFTVSLTPVAEETPARAASPDQMPKDAAAREWRWLTRHKRRSVLESSGPRVETETGDQLTLPDVARADDLAGTLEVMTTPAQVGLDDMPLGLESRPASFSILRLDGRLASSGRWSLGGLLSESQATTWRMAAEFVLEPGDGHELQAGLGYGASYVKRLGGDGVARAQNRTVGTVFLQDRWELSEAVTATLGSRFTYVAYLPDAHNVDPMLSVQVTGPDRTRVTATASARTLTPGGDLLALSSIASAPAMAVAVLDEALRAEKVVRYEVAVDQTLGRTAVRAYVFHEGVRNALANVFEGQAGARALHITNAGAMAARGMGLTVGRRFGNALSGSLTYSVGRGWRPGEPLEEGAPLFARGAGFHDLVGRLEAVIGASDTRLGAFYRLNRLHPDAEGSASNLTSTRFDLQLSQGLPFLGALTRAEWDLLLAVRNLYYEADEAAVLDEVTVVAPPKRVLGGISVRF